MQKHLKRGLEALGLQVSGRQQADLLSFIVLLNRWNRAYNLTAIRDPIEMISRHLLDSLSISRFVGGERVLDLGTGAGVPGIPLAIVHREQAFTLLDSNGKKTRFVTQAVLELGLENVSVKRIRIEDFLPDEKFDTIVVRAFAPLSVILDKTRGLLRAGGKVLAMKGANLELELKGLPKMQVLPLQVPLLSGDRYLVVIPQ